MTFKELFERAKAVDSDDSVCVTFSAWRFSKATHAGGIDPEKAEEVKWTLWSAALKENFYGKTAAEVLAQYVEKRAHPVTAEIENASKI